MKSYVSLLSMLASGIFLVSACGSSAVAPTLAPAVAPTTAPVATTAPAAASNTAKVMVVDSSLGKILVGDNGMTLYMYTKDSSGTATCYDQCATAWPPLLTKDKPQAGDGADATLLGTTARKDGSLQATYKGMPLYYFAKDKAAGDVKGQGVGTVWYVLAPNGDVIGQKGTTDAAATPNSATGAVTISVAKTSLGQVLVDAKGMTLYMYTKDANGESVCYDQCAKNWPPLIVTDKAAAGTGADASLLGTTKRKDGSLQATYKGMPLYYFFKDKAAGDVTGQGVGSVWYVVAANGDVIKGTAGSGSYGYGN